jgi:hypothetical protein
VVPFLNIRYFILEQLSILCYYIKKLFLGDEYYGIYK